MTEFPGHRKSISALAISKDLTRVFSGGDDSKLKVWDTENPKRMPLATEAHTETITSICITTEKNIFISGS